MEKHAVSFVLPGDFRSGGVRVTVLMANKLLERGHSVRILHPKPGISPITLARRFYRFWVKERGKPSGWLNQFQGQIERYNRPDDLQFSKDEVVIAVGTYMVDAVRSMQKPVIKVRFNHGFPAKPTASQDQAWRGEMTTITVSGTLVPQLEQSSGGKVLAVVPNGIDTADYFDEGGLRNGIGAIYNPHPNKAPHDMIALLRRVYAKWPTLPQYVFSTETCPEGLRHTEFVQYPSVPQARALYNKCKIWLLTSYTEGLPGAVLEAMACGCVVITTDNTGSLEILRHDQNGVVVKKGDLPAFVREIERVLGNESFRTRLAENAVATARQYTWDRAAEKMESVLNQLVSAAREKQIITQSRGDY